LQAYRAEIVHFLNDPSAGGKEAYEHFTDGLLVVEEGKVVTVGDATQLLATLPGHVAVEHHPNSLLCPGFIDTHIHYPQTEMIAAYGEQLLQWLETYTFPTEKKFKDKAYAKTIAKRFITELLRNGTTSALVFGTVHAESVDAFFEVSSAKNLRMICGKVLMDRNAPDYLLDTPDSGYTDTKALIQRWHNNGRQRYAVTPRFSPTSSEQQLQKAGELLQEFPDVYMHTHLSENQDEIAWVKDLFPHCDGYLDTYDQAGLLGKRSVFAHCLHLTNKEWKRISETDSNIAFCASSNLFLGSGLFDLNRAKKQNINVGIGTDVGAGTSFSILQTLNEAYKIMQLRGERLSPFQSFYLATLGGAKALDLDDLVGNFCHGKEADFVILDKASTPLMEFRTQQCNNLSELLFVLTMLGDDRTIKQTFAAGNKVHDREQQDEHFPINQ
jgi:guanine deaminase